MTTYYVSPSGNNGAATTTATAKTTISAGCLLAVAGDTIIALTASWAGGIFLAAGTYDDGTTASPITLRSITPLAAKLIASGAPPSGGGNDALIDVRVDSWIIDGFEMTALAGYSGGPGTWSWTLGGAGQFRVGVYVSAFNVKVQNCYIHDICLADPGGSGGAGVNMDGFYTSYITLSNNYAQRNHIHNIGSSLTANKVHGIYFAGPGNYAVSNLVYNNFGGVNITGWHGMDAGAYINNTVFNAGVGLLIGQGDGGVQGGTKNFRGFNNVIQNCPIAVSEQGLIDTAGPRNVWSNNWIHNCASSYQLAPGSTAVNRLSGTANMINYVSTGGGNYHLSANSGLIGAGIASLTGTLAPTLDLDLISRPQGATWDIGAYEFVEAGGDTTSPNLSSPIGSATGQTTGVGRVVTDEANGIAYCWTTTNAVESSANIITNGDTTTVAVAATLTFVLTGLTAATTYFNHFTQIDDAGNTATLVVNSGSFTTASPPAGTNFSVLGGQLRRTLHIR